MQDPENSFLASEARLHAEAAARAGHDDFGDASYLEGLRVVLEAYDQTARFSELGRTLARESLVEVLVRRLHSQGWLQRRQEWAAVAIERPIFILGLVRTGSTALHHLMGQDPETDVVPYWLACRPQPRPPRSKWAGHADHAAAAAELEAMYGADPSLKAIHMMTVDGPEECRHFLAQSFTDDSFEVNATVPDYAAWYRHVDMRPAYRRHRELVELIGGTGPGRRWVLKYPVHMKHLEALLDVYPDACIVQTHRDPSCVLSSYASLIAGFRAIYEDDIDSDVVAREQLESWAAAADAAIEVRHRLDPARFFDLSFRELTADPVGSARRIYDHFGFELSDPGDRVLAEWERANPRGRHGEHSHSLADIALDRGEVLERFAGYMSYFGIEPE